MFQDNWNQNQQLLNAFWSRIGFEQNTNRLILHDGNMRNPIYMDGWQVLNQNGLTYLYDSTTQRLFDRQLNYYYQGNYYDKNGNLLRDFVSESVIDVNVKDVKQSINKDRIFGANGNGNQNIYNPNNYYANYYNKKGIRNNVKNSANPYVINSDAKFAQMQAQKAAKKEQKPIQQEIKDQKVNTKQSIPEPQKQTFVNKQQETVDKIVAEQLALANKKQQEKKSQPKREMVQKRLDGPTLQEKMNAHTTAQTNSKIDMRGHGRQSMTQKVDEFSKIKTANTNKTQTFKTRQKTPHNMPDAATVGKMITGVTDLGVNDFAAKIASDFSQFRYGKVLSKLFRF